MTKAMSKDSSADIRSFDVPTIIADMHGKVLMKHGEGEDTNRPEIDRRDLRILLLNSVPSEKIRWNSKIERVRKQDDGTMAVHCTSGQSESGFRLVVGADGAWSKARSLVSVYTLVAVFSLLTTPQVTSVKPQFAGKYYLTSNISPTNPFHQDVESMVGTGNYMSMGGCRMMAAMRLGDRSYYTIAGIKLPEAWKSENAALTEDPEQLRKELVTKHFPHWSKTNTDLITRSDGDFFVWPLYGLPVETMEWPTVPGLTLVGDAAHIW